jgi:hypothetical protein
MKRVCSYLTENTLRNVAEELELRHIWKCLIHVKSKNKFDRQNVNYNLIRILLSSRAWKVQFCVLSMVVILDLSI